MERPKQATDIDRKLAIYYHPLFQEVIRHILSLFNLPPTAVFQIGLLQFIEFNLKLQKSLLPSFEIQNALVSALNDWVKEVAQCLSYEGMVSTANCEEITPNNLSQMIEKQADQLRIQVFGQREEYLRVLNRVSHHDAFKLLGVRINKEVFNKFMFDLCSTWCEFLDIELFSYFLIALYLQLSQGQDFSSATFRPTLAVTTIDIDFMEDFEELKSQYSRTRKKQLRYYRAWCQWNYLRINQIGQTLILQLDQLHPDDLRVQELALLFQKSIQVINNQIATQAPSQPPLPAPIQGQGEFLVAKQIGPPPKAQVTPVQPTIEYIDQQQEDNYHNFEIEIDAQGNMYLKKIVRLPILGTKIELQPYERKFEVQMRYLEERKDELRKISNLYKRMEHMKVRLEHNVKNDHYNYKQMPKIAQRDKFYSKQTGQGKLENQYTNMPIEKVIHGKVQPEPVIQVKSKKPIPRPLAQIQQKLPAKLNQDFKYKVMAPSFLTNELLNPSYGPSQSLIYGIDHFAQKRDLKIGLPKLHYLPHKIPQDQSYHIVGKLTKDRKAINDKVRSISMSVPNSAPQLNKIQAEKEEFRHVWTKYISEEQMKQLNNYNEFYSKLQQAKKMFSKQHQSDYRVNLHQILLYQNRRYEMGGVITRKQEQQFYQRMKKLIGRQKRREKKREKRHKRREYKKAVGRKDNKTLFEHVFISYHRTVIKDLKQQRSKVESLAK